MVEISEKFKLIEKIKKATKPEELFKETEQKKRRKEWLAYLKIVHPDVGGTEEVVNKLNNLYRGKEEKNNYEVIVQKGGKEHKYVVLEKMNFELGEFWVGKNNLTYLIKKEHKDFFDNAIKRIESIKYPNEAMKEKNKKFIPKIKDSFETEAGDFVLQLHKTEDVFRLGRVKLKKGNLPVEHVAWMITRLLNIGMILNFNGLVHNGITIDNCYCSPQYHSIVLNGGWWYTTKIGEKMTGTTSEVLQVMSSETKSKKISLQETDINSIKDLARRLVGGSFSKFPEEAKKWMLHQETDFLKAYQDWEEILESKKSFGERKFRIFDYED